MKVRFGADEFGLPTFVILLAEGFLLCKGYGGPSFGEATGGRAGRRVHLPLKWKKAKKGGRMWKPEE